MHLSTHFDLRSYTNLHSFFTLLHWHNEKRWHKTCMYSASSKCQYLKVGNRTMRYIGKVVWNVHVDELTDVILPPIQTMKNVILGRKLHFSTLTSPELMRAAWITLNGWSVPHAHSWGISSIGTFHSFELTTILWFLAHNQHLSRKRNKKSKRESKS